MQRQKHFDLMNWLASWKRDFKADKSTPQDNSPPMLLALENRVLYSAVPLPVEAIDNLDSVDHLDSVDDLTSLDHSESIDQRLDHLLSLSEALTLDVEETLPGDTLETSQDDPSELIVVDTSVEGYEQLVADLSSTVPNAEVLVLDAGSQGLHEVTTAIQRMGSVDRLHLVTHGSDGRFQVGVDRIDQTSLADYQQSFLEWQPFLAEDADLMIYGCEVAATHYGQSFIDQLAELSRMDVAASTDLTGDWQQGGDWEFEYHHGDIRSELIFSETIVQSWASLLGVSAPLSTDAGTGYSADHDLGSDFLGNTWIVKSSPTIVGANGSDIYLSKIDSTGVTEFSDIRINTYLNGDQDDVSIAVNDLGDFAVVWTSDVDGYDTVKAKFFAADGTVKVDEFLVNPYLTTARNAAVAIADNGDVVIAWEGSGSQDANGIYAKRFDISGVSQLGTTLVNGSSVNAESGPAVAINDQGDWIVGWSGPINGGGQNVAYLSVFDSQNNLVVDEISAFTGSGRHFEHVVVDIDVNRDFVISATSAPSSPSVLNSQSVRLNIYEYSGSWDSTVDGFFQTSTEVGIDALTQSDQFNGEVQLIDGEAFLVWEGQASDGSDNEGVFYQTIGLDGTATSSVQALGASAADIQTLPELASFHDGQARSILWLDEDGGSYSLKLDVAPTYTNTLPDSNDGSISVLENSSVQLSATDFGYSDAETELGYVRLDIEPTNGYLTINGTRVSAGELIDGDDIRAGGLFYVPEHNYSGSDSFVFTVNDGFDFAFASNTIAITVDEVSHEAPVSFGNTYVSDTGAELVNTDNLLDDQADQEIVALAGGGYVVSWFDSHDNSIRYHVFDGNGSSVKQASLASPGTIDNSQSITELSDGGFLIVWKTFENLQNKVLFNRFDANGDLVAVDGSTDPQSVFINDGIHQYFPAVAGLDDGGWVITWTTGYMPGGSGQDVVAQVYNADGQSSDRFLVNDTVSGTQRDSQVTALDGNRFAIGWTDQNADDHDLFVKVFDVGGQALTGELAVNTVTADRQGELILERLANGNFVAAWSSTGGFDGAGRAVYGAIFDQDGSRQHSGDLQLNEAVDNHQLTPSIVANNGGGFSAFFETYESAANSGDGLEGSIIVRTFDASGNATSGDKLINTMQYGDQTHASAVRLNSGDVILTYQSADGDRLGVDNYDGTNDYGYGIYQERLLQATVVQEGSLTSISLIAELFDGSESISALEIRNLPAEVTLTDGVNSVSGSNANIIGWDWNNLAIQVDAGYRADFDLEIHIKVVDGGDTLDRDHAVRVVVDHQDNALTKPDIAYTTSEESSLEITRSDLLSGAVDIDLRSPTDAPNDSFDLDSLPPVDNGFGTLTWSSSTSALEIEFDSSAASYVQDPDETIHALRGHLYLDGTGGGMINSLPNNFTQKGSIELWIKPDAVINNQLILEAGAEEGGYVLLLKGDVLEFQILTDQGFTQTQENYRLAAAGISSTEFTHVVITYGEDGVAGSDNSMFDVQLYVNGQLRDQLVDIPTFTPGDELRSITAIGVAEANFESLEADYDQGFAGALGKLAFYDKPISAEDVETHYLNTLNTPLPVPGDGSSFTIGSSATLPSGATVSVNSSGNLVYDPNGQFEHLAQGQTTTDSFTYNVENGAGGSDTVVATITIQGANDLPEVTSTLADTIDEDTTLSGDLDNFITDVDETGNLQYQLISGPTNGSATVNTDGTFSYTPANDYTGSDSFSFRVTDSFGGQITATFNITVTPQNDLPTSADKTIDIAQDTQYVFQLADFAFSDSESAFFTHIRIESLPATGTLENNGSPVNVGDQISRGNINALKLIFTGSPADANFDFRISDGSEYSLDAYTITINTNALPLAEDFTRTIDEDSSYSLTYADLNFSDADGDAFVEMTIESLPGNGVLTINGVAATAGTTITKAQLDNGDVVFTPAADEFGAAYASFDYSVTAGSFDSAVYTAAFNVNSVNDLPVGGNASVSINELTTRVLQVTDFVFSDVESTQFDSIEIQGAPTNGQLRLNGTNVTAGQVISYAQIDSGQLTYTDNQTNDAFTFRISDGSDLSAVDYSFSFVSVNVPDPPTASDFTRTINEDGAYAIRFSDLGYGDLDGDGLDHLTIEAVSGGGRLTLSGADVAVGTTVTRAELDAGRLVFTPTANENGLAYASFDFSVSDGGLDSSVHTAVFNVNSVNDLPTSSSVTLSVDELTTRTLWPSDFAFSDVESAQLDSVRITSVPASGSLQLNGTAVAAGDVVTFADLSAGLLTYTDNLADESIEFRVNDGTDDSAANYRIRLLTNNVIRNPNANNDSASVGEGGQITIDVLANDLANATGRIWVSITDGPEHGRVTVDGSGQIVYQHDGSESLTDQITYQIGNTDGRFDTARIELTINPIDDPTIAADDQLRTAFEQQIVLDQATILQNDVDPDTAISGMSLVITTNPNHGTVQQVNGQWVYLPDASFTGTDSFSYQLNPGGGGASNVATVTIDVLPGVVVTSTPVEESTDSESEEADAVEEDSTSDEATTETASTGGNGTGNNKSNVDDGAGPVVAVATLNDGRGPANVRQDNGGEESTRLIEENFQLELVNRSYSYSGRAEGLTLADFYRNWDNGGANSSQVSEFNSNLMVNLFFSNLDQATENYLTENISLGAESLVVSVGSLFTVGYLTWMIRGGVLLSTFMSQTPAYSYFDIGSLLESGRNESIESIVDQ